MSRRLYIAGPVSGIPDLNRPAFAAETARLRALGYDVVNPLEVCASEPECTDPVQRREQWRRCMRADIAAMLTCDTIVLLDGWAKSRGAMLEQHIAAELGMDVVRQGRVTEPCAVPSDEDSLVLKARHWAKCAADLAEARDCPERAREAYLAHQFAERMLRDAVLVLDGGGV